MSIAPFDPWHWLALCQHELLLFAGVFFLIGAVDDLCVDAIYLWLKACGRARTLRRDRAALAARPLSGPAAVFIPAWSEAEVIGDTLAHLISVWPQAELKVYVGCYRNDPATIAAVMAAARADRRVRLVIHRRDGPTTKADCLNRLYRALCADEQRSGRRFGMVVFHDAEDLVDAAALGLLDETIASGADFVQLPVEPLVQRYRSWLGNQLGSHYCEEFAETNWSLPQRNFLRSDHDPRHARRRATPFSASTMGTRFGGRGRRSASPISTRRNSTGLCEGTGAGRQRLGSEATLASIRRPASAVS